MNEQAKCQLCGEPMPVGEEMFNYHGYSGPCPKPPLLEPWQNRVMSEKIELDKKLVDLCAFMDDRKPEYSVLWHEEKDRLQRQKIAMEQYSQVLAERIAAWSV